MNGEMKKNGPYEPASDELVAYWQAQVDYARLRAIGPMDRSGLGAILARLAQAERDRDAARREICEEAATVEKEWCGDAVPMPTAAEIAAERYGTKVAARLFPPADLGLPDGE